MNEFEKIIQNLRIKNFDKALEQCKLYENKQNQHIIFNLKGVIFTQKENYKLAEENFLKSIKSNDKFVDPIKNLYLHYLKYENYSKLIEYANKLVHLDNQNPTYNYFLAHAFELSNKPDEAIKFYKINIDLNGKEKKKSLNNMASIFFF